MASSTPNTILLQINGADRPADELLADGAITPGDVLHRSSATEVAAATTTASPSVLMVAVERSWKATADTAGIDEDYADADQVVFVRPQRGDLFYGTLANGENVAVNAPLTYSTDAGHVAAATLDATFVVGDLIGYAEEAVNASAAAARIKIRAA